MSFANSVKWKAASRPEVAEGEVVAASHRREVGEKPRPVAGNR